MADIQRLMLGAKLYNTYNQQLALIAELHNLNEDQTRQLDLQIHMAVLQNPVMTIYEFADEITRRTVEREAHQHDTR